MIKNKYIKVSKKKGVWTGGFNDIWEEYANLLRPYIPEGMTIYGEIFGYATGDTKMIQKGYDYGCKVGKNKFMPYRITTKECDGRIREWNVSEVYNWTVNLMNTAEELSPRIHPIDILWHGTLHELYPNIKLSEHWSSDVLEALKNEKRFGMEMQEPMCVQTVPREGIVLRIDDDLMREAFKLKTVAFFEREKKLIDQGEVDTEIVEGLQDSDS